MWVPGCQALESDSEPELNDSEGEEGSEEEEHNRRSKRRNGGGWF